MIALKLKENYLDINNDQSIAIERNSPIWMGDEIDVVPGDVVIPFDLPLTARNNAHLGFLDSLNNRKQIVSFKNAALEIEGNTHLSGTLEVEKITGNGATARIYSGVGALQNLKNSSIRDSSLYAGNALYIHNVAAMTNTTNISQDILFVPFFDVSDVDSQTHYNIYDSHAEQFESATDAVPFFSAVALLEQLIQGQGWTLVWSQSEVWRDFLYIVSEVAVSSSFRKTNILPDVTATHFIKTFADAVGCVVFADAKSKRIHLKPYANLRIGKVMDWTDYLLEINEQVFVSSTFEKDFGHDKYTITPFIFQKTITPNQQVTSSQLIESQETRMVLNHKLEGTQATLKFILYQGKNNATITTNNGNTVASQKYPIAGVSVGSLSLSQNAIDDRFNSWNRIMNKTKLLTVSMFLPSSVLNGFRFSALIRIFNAKDGDYYRFLVKSIKSSVNTRQREIQKVELLLID